MAGLSLAIAWHTAMSDLSVAIFLGSEVAPGHKQNTIRTNQAVISSSKLWTDIDTHLS